MRKLLEFLIGKRHWLLFIVLELISFVLIFNHNAYQQNRMLGASNVAAAKVASISASVTSYFNLQDENKSLLEKNTLLQMQILDLEDRIDELLADTISFQAYRPDSTEMREFTYFPAEVVRNSTVHLLNYVTIDKGSADGIKQDMGVVSNDGVVGVVSAVSRHYAVVIPIINTKFKLSCKILNKNYFGSLAWNGRDSRFANMEELPSHAKYASGDTIITSGYSAIFPAGLVIGRVEKTEEQKDANFNVLKIRLSTDFTRLKNVMVIHNDWREEQVAIQKEAMKND